MTLCTCPGACDCLEADDLLIASEWSAWDAAQTPDHRLAALPTGGLAHQQRSLTLVTPVVRAADPETTASHGSAARPPHRLARHVRRDELRARTRLYPVGDVKATPVRPPVNESSLGSSPEAA